jgi:hypothetical protein
MEHPWTVKLIARQGVIMATFDVTAYGAVGNGSTDNTGSIQEAIDIAATGGGGIVYFPRGTYPITAPLVLRERLILQGDGPLVSSIRQQRAGVHGLLMHARAPFISIESLKITGPGRGEAAGDGIHMTGNPMSHVVIRDCVISDFGGHGMYLGGAIVSLVQAVVCRANGMDGFHFDGKTESAITGLSVISCYANDNSGSGYYLDNFIKGAYSAFLGCAADSNAISYCLRNANYVSFSGCGSEWLPDPDFQLRSGQEPPIGWKIEGCLGITLSSCFVLYNHGIGYLLASNMVEGTRRDTLCATLAGNRVSSPQSGATADVQIDAHSHALMLNNQGTRTGNRIFGLVTLMNDPMRLDSRATPNTPENPDKGIIETLVRGVGATAYATRTVGDKVPRFDIRGDGTLEWRGGNAEPDVKLYRTATGVLRVDAPLRVLVVEPPTTPRPAPASVRRGTMIYDAALGRPLWFDGTSWRDATGTPAP